MFRSVRCLSQTIGSAWKIVLLLPLLSTPVLSVPSPTARSDDVDIENPSASDPESPPSSMSLPDENQEIPYPWGIPTQPDQCDGEHPSKDCFDAMQQIGGYLWYDKNSKCSETQKGIVQTAVNHAMELARYSSQFPNNGKGLRGHALGNYWMGPDWDDYKTRIAGNFKRVAQFHSDQTSTGEYITISCADPENQCSTKQKGKEPGVLSSVGGYARSYKEGWFRYWYHYINFCDAFFRLDTLAVKNRDVFADLARGSTQMATDARMLANTGQFFLHEMMHTRLADGGVEPHIADQFVEDQPPESKGYDKRAYGPTMVRKLAMFNLNQGGGARRASLNADSYAMLANAAYWWRVTKYFPNVPKYRNSDTDQNDIDYPIFLHLRIDDDTDMNPDNVTSSLTDQVETYDLDAYDTNDDRTASSTSDTPSSTTSAASPATDPAPPPATDPAPPPADPTPEPEDADICGVSYKVLWDKFDISGKNFDADKFGTDGSGLKDQIGGCGALTEWSFDKLTDDADGWQWRAQGRLPIGTKACVGRAVVSAGGASADGCTGAG